MFIAPGEFLCMEGDKSSSLYIVKSGLLIGTSSNKESGQSSENYGPGSLIGEFSLLEDAPCKETIRAAETSEVIEITQDVLNSNLEQRPFWLKSILSFLSSRYHLAEENKQKSNLIQTLPPLLYLMTKAIENKGSDLIPLKELHRNLKSLNGTTESDLKRILQLLEELDLLTLKADYIRVSSLQLIPLLYETLRYRALSKKVSPNILPMSDQMILSAFVQAARENGAPLQNGICTISTEQLKTVAKQSMHGITLTSRLLYPLVQKGILKPSSPFNIHSALESIESFEADFEKVLDMLELNRIFPLLDKKLVQ